MPPSFILDIQGPTATLTLNRPDKHNALDVETILALDAAVVDLSMLPALRCLMITGTGKSFCAGANLDGVGGQDWRDNPLERLTERLENLPFPTLCVLNGGVYGGGTDVALACDFRLGVEGMKCFIPPARLGVHYPPGGLKRAVTRLGLGPAKRLFLATETMDAPELLRVGFLDWLVAADALARRAAELVDTISGLAPTAVRGMKRALNEIANGELDRAAAVERSGASFFSRDHEEAKAAMAEKRKPLFTGN